MNLISLADFHADNKALSSFQREVISNTLAAIQDEQFPCYYAKSVIPKNSLYFAFVSNDASELEQFRAAQHAFDHYAQLEQQPDPYRVFILTFEKVTHSWDEDHQFMWRFMEFLHSVDTSKWNPAIPNDCDSNEWSFSYKNMPWFFNLNSPNNCNRPSRNVTQALSIILQRTDSFEFLINEALTDEQKEIQRLVIRNDIRSRISNYDNIPVSPALAGEEHNKEMIEWKQFHLPIDNETPPPAKCPFHAIHANENQQHEYQS